MRELRKNIQSIEIKYEILKMLPHLLMSDSLNNSR